MKKCAAAVLAALVGLGSIPAAGAEGLSVSAESAVLMEAETGRVLWEQDARTPRLIASVTKLMTALVALESGHGLEETVTVAPEWAGVEGSSIYLQPGEEITLEALLYGLLLQSGNDAAAAVAGFCGGSQEAFVAAMNWKAAELGMAGTRFENPSGLDGEDHRSTAYDLALLARACLENETLAGMVSAKSVTFGTRTFTNHNKLLWRYEGCVGLKTGYTQAAGRTLVSAAEREGMTLICVTLDAPDDWSDHAALLDLGFARYRVERCAAAGEALCRLPVEGSLAPFCPVTAAGEAALCLAEGERAQRVLRLSAPALSAPVPAGTPVGEVLWLLEGEVLARAPLVTARAAGCDLAPERGLLGRLLGRLTG